MVSFTVFKGSQDGSIVESKTTKPDKLEGDQVFIRITASGLCGTDEHYRKADMALGHEGVGVVEDVGPAVHSLKKGDRVGWGYQQNSCLHCDYCLSGRETYCEERAMYGYANFDQGSMASHAVWSEAFLYKIPDNLTDTEAAPLMCGGATVFNALRMYNIQPTDRVGVIGVGGLGHLAIQYASKMGCDVVVLSGTESKREEAMKLGASEFIAMKGKDKLDVSKPINCLLITTSAQPAWDLVLPAMANDSTVFPLTVAGGDLSLPYMPFLSKGLRIQGSVVAGRHYHRQMLEFSALHQIKPMEERFPMSQQGITDAFQRLNDGKMRYRGVLVPQN